MVKLLAHTNVHTFVLRMRNESINYYKNPITNHLTMLFKCTFFFQLHGAVRQGFFIYFSQDVLNGLSEKADLKMNQRD